MRAPYGARRLTIRTRGSASTPKKADYTLRNWRGEFYRWEEGRYIAVSNGEKVAVCALCAGVSIMFFQNGCLPNATTTGDLVRTLRAPRTPAGCHPFPGAATSYPPQPSRQRPSRQKKLCLFNKTSPLIANYRQKRDWRRKPSFLPQRLLLAVSA